MSITYRSNKTGTLQAAYSHLVRIGYVEQRMFARRWFWQLIFLMPSGGAYMGFVDSEVAAKESLEKNYQHWMACAGLQATAKETNYGEPQGIERHDRSAAERNRRAAAEDQGGAVDGDLRHGGPASAGERTVRPKAKRRRTGDNRSK